MKTKHKCRYYRTEKIFTKLNMSSTNLFDSNQITLKYFREPDFVDPQPSRSSNNNKKNDVKKHYFWRKKCNHLTQLQTHNQSISAALNMKPVIHCHRMENDYIVILEEITNNKPNKIHIYKTQCIFKLFVIQSIQEPHKNLSDKLPPFNNGKACSTWFI